MAQFVRYADDHKDLPVLLVIHEFSSERRGGDVGKRALDATGVSRRHLLLVTDGENTDGFEPGEVAVAIGQRPFDERPSIYFVAFDIEARRFRDVQTAGGLVMEAASGKALGETIDSLLRGKILIER